jgi:hypothetical protein
MRLLEVRFNYLFKLPYGRLPIRLLVRLLVAQCVARILPLESSSALGVVYFILSGADVVPLVRFGFVPTENQSFSLRPRAW